MLRDTYEEIDTDLDLDSSDLVGSGGQALTMEQRQEHLRRVKRTSMDLRIK